MFRYKKCLMGIVYTALGLSPNLYMQSPCMSFPTLLPVHGQEQCTWSGCKWSTGVFVWCKTSRFENVNGKNQAPKFGVQ